MKPENSKNSELALQVSQLSQAISVFAASENLSNLKVTNINELEQSPMLSSTAMLPVSLMVAELQRVAKMDLAGQTSMSLSSPLAGALVKQLNQSLTVFESIEYAVKLPNKGYGVREK